MLRLNENIKITAFADFKSIVKCALGMQMFKPSDYYIRQAAGTDNLFTIRFSSHTPMSDAQLKRCWEIVYKDCLEHGLGDSCYKKDYMPEPIIDNGTLIFTIDFIN